jgi:hypothetical protein
MQARVALLLLAWLCVARAVTPAYRQQSKLLVCNCQQLASGH